MDCLFCKIINKEVSSYKIHEDDVVYAFLDINPDSVGHTLIIPKKHYLDLDDIDIEVLKHIMEIAKMLKKRIEERLNCDGMTLIQNSGDIQIVKHFHLHLLPKYINKPKLSIDEIYEILKQK